MTSGKEPFYLRIPQSSKYNEVTDGQEQPLYNFDYTIEVRPRTNYWRFGLRFHRELRESTVIPGQLEHNIIIGAGVEDTASGRQSRYDYRSFVITHTGLSPIADVPPAIPYQPQSAVYITLSVLGQTLNLHIGFPEYGQDLSFLLTEDDFQYFTLYACSENEPVEVEGFLDKQPKVVSTTATTTTQSPPQSNAPEEQPLHYYILKIRDETWNTKGFEPGKIATFGTYESPGKKRPDYDLFAQLKPGDQLIGYECETDEEIVCIFQLTEYIHFDENKEEIVSLEITKCIRPPIPLDHFRQKINFVGKLFWANPERIISITAEQFNALLQPRQLRDPHSSILGSFTKEGDHLKTVDQLNFEYDYLSFATIIALKNVKPPLAIGLFGNWGSGKSFFMEKLENEIRDKTEKNPGDLFVQNVVHVKFNSWHYSDANLWASLISKIFEELYLFASDKKKLSDLETITNDLKITQLQKDVTSAKKIALENRQLELQREQENMRKTLRNRTGLDTLKTLITDPKLREDLVALDNQNVEGIFNEVDKVQSFINEVQSERKRWTYFLRTYFSSVGRWLWILVLVVVIAYFSWLVNHVPVVKELWSNITNRLLAYAVLVGGVFERLRKGYIPIKKAFDEAYTRLVSLRKTMDAAPVNESPKAAELRNEIESNQKELEALKTKLEKLDAQQTETKNELDTIRSGKKLMEFIEQKSTGEVYSKQLGLISLIRKDFEQLDKLLRQQEQANSTEANTQIKSSEKIIEQETSDPTVKAGEEKKEKLRIDRIVLYIDDLDRCNEDIVVHVLEAVHLLLTFELFVVVVGVDPRWLNKSLNKKFSFFSENGHPKKVSISGQAGNEEDKENDDDNAISSFDYLEKIFQIPFALKPITKEGRESLIGYLVEKEIEKEIQNLVRQNSETTTQDAQGDNNIGQHQAAIISGGVPGPSLPSDSAKGQFVTEVSTTAQAKAAATTTALKALKFTNEEAEFMKEVSVLFGRTPRTIKRFVNIYRVIKSHGSLDPSSDYRATLLVLAVIVGCPDHAQEFVRQLRISNHNIVQDLLTEPKLSNLLSWVEKQLDNKPFPKAWRLLSVSSLQTNVDLISRFSFRTYAL